MTPTGKKLSAFRIDPELLSALQQIKERDGIPISEQVRRALRTWIVERGIDERAERKRVAPRKRS